MPYKWPAGCYMDCKSGWEILTRICSWCGTVLGYALEGTLEDGLTTYTICQECAEKEIVRVEEDENRDQRETYCKKAPTVCQGR